MALNNKQYLYFVHGEYSVSSHGTWKEALNTVRREAKAHPNVEYAISRVISRHKATAGNIKMIETTLITKPT